MKKHDRYKYTLMFIVALILAVVFRVYFYTRNLNLTERSVVSFEYFLAAHDDKCNFQTNNGYEFKWPHCENYTIGEYYTILGSATAMSDNSNYGYISVDVSEISLLSVKKFSLKGTLRLIFGYLILPIRNVAYRMKSILARYLAGDSLSLVLGLVLGSRFADFSQEMRSLIKDLGLSHMVAVSGFHLSVVYLILANYFAKWQRPKLSFVIVVLFLAWYTVLVSNPASLLRALFMLVFSLIGRIFFKKRPISLFIFVQVFALLVLISASFLFNVGFLLSFASTLGVLLVGRLDFFSSSQPGVSSLADSRFKLLFSSVDFIKGSILTSLAAQLTSLPVLLNCFGEISPFGFLSCLLFSGWIGLIVSWSVPLMFIAWFFGLFFHFIITFLGPYFLFLGDVVNLLIYVLEFSSRYIGVLLVFEHKFSSIEVFVYFSFLFALVWLSRRRSQVVVNYVF